MWFVNYVTERKSKGKMKRTWNCIKKNLLWLKNYTTVDIWDLFSIITVTLLFSVVGVLPHQQPSGLALTASNTTFHFGQTTISDIVPVPSQSLFGPVTLPRAHCCCCCCCWWRRTAGSNQLQTEKPLWYDDFISLWYVTSFFAGKVTCLQYSSEFVLIFFFFLFYVICCPVPAVSYLFPLWRCLWNCCWVIAVSKITHASTYCA